MGIKNFGTILKKAEKGVIKVTFQDLQKYGIHRVAIDGSVFLYRFAHNAANKRPNSHLDGFYQLFLRLLKYNLQPVLIFDGHAPHEKRQALETRAEHKHRALEKLASLQQELAILVGAKEPIPLDQINPLMAQVKGTTIESNVSQCVEKIHKADKNIIHLTPGMYEDLSQLCQLMNVPVLRANGEADVLCVQLCRSGQVQAILSEDSDILLYGGSRLIRKFGWTDEVELIELDVLLKSLHLTYDQFVDVALLCGTDYTEPLKGISPSGIIEAIVNGRTLIQLVGPDDFKQYQEAQHLITSAGDREIVPIVPVFKFQLYQNDQLTRWMSEKCHYRPITITKHYNQLRVIYTPLPSAAKIKIVLKSKFTSSTNASTSTSATK